MSESSEGNARTSQTKKSETSALPAHERGRGEGSQKTMQPMMKKDGKNGSASPESYLDMEFTIRVPYWLVALFLLTLIFIAFAACFLRLLMKESRSDPHELMHQVQSRSGKNVVDLFKSFDRNRDGYLSALEFEPLIPYFTNLSQLVDKVRPIEEAVLEYEPDPGEEIMVIHAHFTPLLLETMTKEDILNFPITGNSALWGFRNWKVPNRQHLVFGAGEFKSMLPEDMTDLVKILGQPYYLLDYSSTTESVFDMNVHLSNTNSKFYPTMPQGHEKVLFRLLNMMHPRPFTQNRFGPKGTVACIQAYNEEYVHVVFRMHAEFQLSEPPCSPFWFTPGQFLGDLVISRNGTHVHYFHMHVPNDKRLNVDMEWMTGGTEDDGGMEVDIGYMPLMKWTLEAESVSKAEADNVSAPVTYKPDHVMPLPPEKMRWSEVVPRDQVLRQIEVVLYPFKQVTYHNLTYAVELSKELNRPLHGIFLWGALDDQSC